MNESRTLTLKNYLGYGVTDILGSGAFAVMGAWLMYFYVTYCGLSPIEAGSILFIARILDTIISPLVGYITDNIGNTRIGRRFGRRRSFLLLCCPLLIIFSLMWIDGMHYAYYLTTYLLMEVVAAMIIIPYEAIASEMTSDYKQRTRLSASRIIFGGLAASLATFIPGQLFRFLGNESAQAFLINGMIFTVLTMGAVIITFFTTWERDDGSRMPPAKPVQSLRELFSSIIKEMLTSLKVRAFRQLLLMYILSFTALDVLSSVFAFFIIFALNQNATLAANLMSVGIFCFGWGTAVFAWAFIRYKPARLLQLCYLMVMLCMLAFTAFYFYQPSWMIPALFGIAFIYQLFKGGYVYLTWNIYPFIPDVDEVMTRRRREGIFAGMMTFVRKSTLGASALIVCALLEMNGFVSGGTTQTKAATETIVGIVCLGTIALLLIAFIVATRFKLDRRTHRILLDEISRLKTSGGDLTNSTVETRVVIESLTGSHYENIWQGKQKPEFIPAMNPPVDENRPEPR